ncbi:retrovirus-related pol polyprotein from transposon TNT 1-94 [Tanacetum coccineum]
MKMIWMKRSKGNMAHTKHDRARKFYQRIGKKIIIDGSSTAGYDKSKVECFNCHKMRHFARECIAPRSKDQQNWNQEEEIQANHGSQGNSQILLRVTNNKSCSKACFAKLWKPLKKYDGHVSVDGGHEIKITNIIPISTWTVAPCHRTNKEVADKVKDHKRKHDSDDDEENDDDEGPSAGSNQGKSAKRRRYDSGASGSAQPPTKDDKSDTESEHSEQSLDDIPMQDEGHVSDMEDTDNAHIPKVSTTTWFKPILEVPAENKLQRKTYDIGSFIKWFCRRTGKKKLCKADLEGPAFNLVKAFHKNSVFLQYQMNECHKLLTNKVDMSNPEGHQILQNIYEPLPLGGPPGQVTIQPQFFFNKDLDYLLTGDKERKIALSISKLKAACYLDFGLEELVPSLWVESEREYDISAVYGITHWWFRRKEFYINKHSESSDREAVRSQMGILSVISVKVFEKYGYNYLREIILHRADYQEYKILEKDFKNLHPNDFEDLFLLNIQEKLNHLPKTDKTSLHTAVNMWIRNLVIRNRVGDLQLGIESYQTKINLERPNWDAADYYFKEDYTIVPKPRAVVYRDRNDQRKLMSGSNESDEADMSYKLVIETLLRVMENWTTWLNAFHLFEYNRAMEIGSGLRMTSEEAKTSITAIEKRLQISRSIESRKLCWEARIRDIGSWLDQQNNVDDMSVTIKKDILKMEMEMEIRSASDIKNGEEWHGQFARGDKKCPTIMLEVVASYDLWIWHAFFGVAGANNDITVLNNSPFFDDRLDDIAP